MRRQRIQVRCVGEPTTIQPSSDGHSRAAHSVATVPWATNKVSVVEVTGPGVLDVTVWRQAGSLTVHLVNLTNPMLMKGPVRELLPVGEQAVRIRLPEGQPVRLVHLLRADQTPTVVEEPGYLTVTVPSIADIEVIAINWQILASPAGATKGE